MNLSNIRVAPKLWLTVLGLLVVMTLSNLWVQQSTIHNLEQSRADVQRIEHKISLALHMRGDILRSLETSTAQLATSEELLQNEFSKRLDAHLKDVSTSMDAMRAALVSAEDHAQFDAMVEAFDNIQARRILVESTLDSDDYLARTSFAFGEYSQLTSTYLEALQKLIDLQNQQLSALTAHSDAQTQRHAILGKVVTAALLLLGIVLTRWLVQTIHRPLQQAVQLSTAIGEGNLSVSARAERKDEFGALMNALDTMAERLRSVVVQVRSGVCEVSSASTEVANGSRDLSARTEQTAANLQQTAASIEQMSSSMAQAADNMRQTNQLALSAVQAAERGGEVVQQVVQSMEHINSSSRKISDIIGVIDGIAFQTNILALNAAVEAARAGEQGRGFAVVAGEVRSLAQRSAEAAKEIKGLINASVSSVSTGSEQVLQAGQSMQEIVASVRRVTDLVGEINAVAAEQSTGFGQVNQAVTNLDQMTQQNAALVEETSASASAMREQAQRLMQVVSVFNVGQALTPPPNATAHAVPTKAASAHTKHPAAAETPAHTPTSGTHTSQALPTPITAAPSGRTSTARATASADDDWETF